MTSNEPSKQVEILLENAGFCISGNLTTYCGQNVRYEGLQVVIKQVDYWTIELKLKNYAS
jgi:hypothetical protein